MNPLIVAYETLLAFIPVWIIFTVVFLLWVKLGGMKDLDRLVDYLESETKQE